MELANSTRSIPKSTYVHLDLRDRNAELSRPLEKAQFLRSLALQEGEVERALSHPVKGNIKGKDDGLSNEQTSSGDLAFDNDSRKHRNTVSLLREFEGKKQLPALSTASNLAETAAPALLSFGDRLVALRQAALEKARASLPADAENKSSVLDGHVQQVRKARAGRASFSSSLARSPIGMLNLERLDMRPAGLERGELIATIPLAPREKTSVVQQEWSTISKEFTSIVTDSLENYSETGVAESTELAMATSSQTAHANQFNVTASASGGYGFVTGSVSSSFSAQDQSSTSATESRKHAESTTKKASSRVTQSRQTTIKTVAASGSSSSTTRTLENPSDTKPMRIDYFSMMRKWHVGLYRYGLRMTYDLTVPEPGAAMRQIYADIDTIKQGLTERFNFTLRIDDINTWDYENIAATYKVKLPPPPPDQSVPLRIAGSIPGLIEDNDSSWIQNSVDFQVKDGYEIKRITLDLILSNWDAVKVFSIVGCGVDCNVPKQADRRIGIDLGTFLVGQIGAVKIVYFAQYYGNGMYSFNVEQTPTEETMLAWRTTVLGSIYDSALADFTAKATLLEARLQELRDQLANVDTLTLRREENDEIMKCVLRWLLGPEYVFVPPDVEGVFARATGGDNTHGIHFAGNETTTATDWSIMSHYGAIVTFLNSAIEWENVVYFLYSYFWDAPPAWRFIRSLQHPDATRQSFLRSGSARVALTIRKGFETAFTWFVEHGNLDVPDSLPRSPYLTVAQQIQNYDNTNYPGIPPANPAGKAMVGGQYAGTVGVAQVDAGTEVTIRVRDATGFVVGNQVVIDDYQSGVQERQTLLDVIAEKNVLVVARLDGQHGVEGKEFPIYQAGEQGLLIAEWFEYTPSHGTMIEVDSKLETMA